ELIADLRAAAVVRNVMCHGSWGMPDDADRSLPLFVNKRIEKFETPIDIAYLEQLQRHTAELACAVINTVTHMGWQFPGSSGPEDPILRRNEGATVAAGIQLSAQLPRRCCRSASSWCSHSMARAGRLSRAAAASWRSKPWSKRLI